MAPPSPPVAPLKKKEQKKRHSTRNVVSGFIGFGPGSDRVFPPGRRHESGRLFFDCFSFFICFPLEPVAVTGDGVGCGGGGRLPSFSTEFSFSFQTFRRPRWMRRIVSGASCRFFIYLFIYLFKKKDKNVTLASFALNFVEKNSFFLLIFARFNNLLRNGIWLLGVVLFQPFFFERTERLSIEEFRFFFFAIYFGTFGIFPPDLGPSHFVFRLFFFLREKGNDFRSRNAVIGFYF